jgi:hypothetical protein
VAASYTLNCHESKRTLQCCELNTVLRDRHARQKREHSLPSSANGTLRGRDVSQQSVGHHSETQRDVLDGTLTGIGSGGRSSPNPWTLGQPQVETKTWPQIREGPRDSGTISGTNDWRGQKQRLSEASWRHTPGKKCRQEFVPFLKPPYRTFCVMRSASVIVALSAVAVAFAAPPTPVIAPNFQMTVRTQCPPNRSPERAGKSFATGPRLFLAAR